jgi:hypothetical protein
MNRAQILRHRIRDNLNPIVNRLNEVLSGQGVDALELVLERVGRGGRLPHWYLKLLEDGSLPNLDGKTIGSVIEMLLVGVLETLDIDGETIPPQRINPARGVDLPDLQLGVKSPSENYCTSEPFFSAYERLLGSEFDIVVLLTDYQTKKKSPPLCLQIINSAFLTGTQVADRNLCEIARNNREWLLEDSEARAVKLFRFLAYINQSDWLGRKLLGLTKVLQDDNEIKQEIEAGVKDFEKKNKEFEKKDKPLIPEDEKDQLHEILKIKPLYIGVVDALDNWVINSLRDAARAPNENELERLKSGPLDGRIGLSFALQWRYNFGSLFGDQDSEDDCDS